MSEEDDSGNSGCGCLLLIIFFFFVIPECDKQNKKIKTLEKKVQQIEGHVPAEQPVKPWKKGTE
jgi:hypothetical protein